LEKRERQLILREKEAERKSKLAEEQSANAEKVKREYETLTSERAKIISAVPPVPLFSDKENATDVPASKDATQATHGAKPLQPLHNIYDRREKLLARLLNHRIGTAE